MKFLSAVFVLCVALGCKASAGGRVNSAGDVEGEATVEGAEGDEFDGFAASSPPSLQPPQGDLDQPRQPALLGARHDLFLKSGAATHRCRCLSVATGQAGDAAFEWESAVPRVSSDQHLVVAFSSDGQACEGEPEGSLGAGYHGYEKRDGDVIIMIEAAVEGRPRVNGAIVPRPEPGKRLLMRPVPTALPYGRSLEGEAAQCVVPTDGIIGAPGPVAIDVEAEPEPDADLINEPFESLEDDPNHPTDDRGEIAQRRTGLYLGAMLGPGYALVTMPDTDSSFEGLGVDFDLMLGGSPTKDLAIGVVVGAEVTPDPNADVGGTRIASDGVSINYARFGAFGDYYFVEDSNLHALLELGYASVSFTGPGVFRDQPQAGGFTVGAGLGYDFWIAQRWSLGFIGRLNYAWLSADGDAVRLMLPVLAATVAFH